MVAKLFGRLLDVTARLAKPVLVLQRLGRLPIHVTHPHSAVTHNTQNSGLTIHVTCQASRCKSPVVSARVYGGRISRVHPHAWQGAGHLGTPGPAMSLTHCR